MWGTINMKFSNLNSKIYDEGRKHGWRSWMTSEQERNPNQYKSSDLELYDKGWKDGEVAANHQEEFDTDNL